MAVQHFKTSGFDAAVEAAPLAMIDFWADWCGPCRMLGPTVEALAEEHPEILVGKVNVDHNPDLARTFRISRIPTVVARRDGEIVGQIEGVHSKEELLSLL